MADLAVVIVSHNSAKWLEKCFGSVAAHSDGVELESVLVDAASVDGSAELVEALFPDVRVLRCDNRGFAYANNRALMTVQAPFVLFLNPDTEVLRGDFRDLLDWLRERPQVGLVGCCQLDSKGALQPTICRFPNALRSLFQALGSARLPFGAGFLTEREYDLSLYDREVSCDWTSGSFMLARREAIFGAGLMDERCFLYCEEPDLCLRIKRAGWEVRHVPLMTIVHHVGSAGGGPRLAAQDAVARRWYFEKHFSRPHRYAAMTATSIGYGLRAVIGSADGGSRRDRRVRARAALRALVRLDPPPFGDPPACAVAPPDETQTKN